MSRIGIRKTGRPATYADLEAVPQHLVAEILAGDLVTHPRPSPRHSTAHASLIEELAGPFQKGRRGGPGGWLFLTEPEIHLGEHVIVPDIAAGRRDRMSSAQEGSGIKVVPDWVCEVLSPSTVSYDRTVKFRIYINSASAISGTSTRLRAPSKSSPGPTRTGSRTAISVTSKRSARRRSTPCLSTWGSSGPSTNPPVTEA